MLLKMEICLNFQYKSALTFNQNVLKYPIKICSAFKYICMKICVITFCSLSYLDDCCSFPKSSALYPQPLSKLRSNQHFTDLCQFVFIFILVNLTATFFQPQILSTFHSSLSIHIYLYLCHFIRNLYPNSDLINISQLFLNLSLSLSLSI